MRKVGRKGEDRCHGGGRGLVIKIEARRGKCKSEAGEAEGVRQDEAGVK